jgi:hypothetical protein
MRFKYWFETGMHGGVFDTPYTTNDNMPVQSKYTTKDRVKPSSDDDVKINPDRLYGIDKKTKARRINTSTGSIVPDDRRRDVPISIDRPDIIY